MNWVVSPQGLFTALGLGLMIGVVRERLHREDEAVAGVRTHALVALGAAIAGSLGTAVLVTVLILVGLLAIAAHLKTAAKDPGLTGEFALLLTALLAALAQTQPVIAAATGVLVATLLFAKRPLHKFARDVVSEHELQDALLLAGAALVVLPLLPDMPVDPWGVLVPAKLWRLVVLIMAVGMVGHIALRLVGARWGLPVAGFFAGLASSTAAVASFGHRARLDARLTGVSASAALIANLGSLLLFAAIVGAGAPQLLTLTRWSLVASALVLLVAGAVGLRATPADSPPPKEPPARAFRPLQALLLAAAIAALLLVSAWLRSLLGEAGAIAAAMVVALAEQHSAAASVAQLFAAGEIVPANARWALVGLLAASGLAKSVLAFVAGGNRYGWRVTTGLACMVGAAAVTAAVF
ncbi:MAG TPA: MgtC/SapB family protein [Steroidobacteraceae bacterium]|nr:MgtC/SapB family protein [Steroidobacteraceae bacterium]